MLTSSATDLNLVDGSQPGVVVPNKAVVYSSSGVINATGMKLEKNSDETNSVKNVLTLSHTTSSIPVSYTHLTLPTTPYV